MSVWVSECMSEWASEGVRERVVKVGKQLTSWDSSSVLSEVGSGSERERRKIHSIFL